MLDCSHQQTGKAICSALFFSVPMNELGQLSRVHRHSIAAIAIGSFQLGACAPHQVGSLGDTGTRTRLSRESVHLN